MVCSKEQASETNTVTTTTTTKSTPAPTTNDGKDNDDEGLTYLSGFGNTFESECLEGALPKGRNNPRLVPYQLYTEQLSGTAFTSPRVQNRRTWLYRIQPSVVGTDSLFQKRSKPFGGDDGASCVNPNPIRWLPMPLSKDDKVDFEAGMKRILSSGSPLTKNGLAIYMYTCNTSMVDKHMYNSDGDFLVVPQFGSLLVLTELGKLVVHPKEICVLPRGLVFSVHLQDNVARGYVLEVYKGHFALPELGPIGSNGLANARDFLHPTAWCVENQVQYRRPCTVLNKFGGELFERSAPHSPYNVVGWHGNYLPFKYDLTRFCVINSVTFDHMDPSIYTVLTCVGVDHEPLADFVIFPPRIMATDANTFRPPWFHRNTMSEFMGLIYGSYDAKESDPDGQTGFLPGGASFHPCMTPHGPDTASYQRAVSDPCEAPALLDAGLAFMFETSLVMETSAYGQNCSHRDLGYAKTSWSQLPDTFTGWDLLSSNKKQHTK